MPRIKKVIPKEQQAIIETLKLFLSYYSNGLLPFIESSAMPDAETVAEMVLADLRTRSSAADNTRVQGGEHIPQAQRLAEMADTRVYSVIRDSGGLELWRAVFADFQKAEPELSAILRDLSRVGGYRFPTVSSVAWQHDLERAKVYIARDKAFKEISGAILYHSAQMAVG